MDSSIPPEIQRLLTEYCFEIDSSTNNYDLTCKICKRLINDAYQAPCGCKYCRSCISGYLSTGNYYCLGENEDCKDERLVLDYNVTRSHVLNKQLLKVKVICPHESCNHSAELTKIDNHIRICNKQSIECPYTEIGCDNKLYARDVLLEHFNVDIIQHTQLLMTLIINLRNEADVMKVNYDNLKDNLEKSLLDTAILKEDSINKDTNISALERESKEYQTKTLTLEKQSKEYQTKTMTLEKQSKEYQTKISALEKESKEFKNQILALEHESKKFQVKKEVVDANADPVKDSIFKRDSRLFKSLNQNLINVFIRNFMTKQTVKLKCSQNITIDELKALLMQKFNSDIKYMTLMYQGQILDKGLTLCHYDIGDDDTVLMVETVKD